MHLRAHLAVQVQCLAPGAMRLSACFKEARHLLAKALTDLAANEVESLSAALEKEVPSTGSNLSKLRMTGISATHK